ncbi:phosphatidylinositol-specific phospholipase C domain-containing protein [Aquimarina pacifica]|uniref:phosphatidylinositol-specific phospholipase C domain-containing protein n=1 Tax=Aquimarina pacifica TaxID=1296415 RepID=UPI00046F1FEF|nr:phosphatidylinositol-specific phospholipase C domain-containing protein [Aquimarina pacifica]
MNNVLFNADVGEETGVDDQIMPYISWCNIACGSHAGSEKEIEKTIQLAIKHNVKIGAHPSYPDRSNFGRKVMSLPYEDLVQSLTEQLKVVNYYIEKNGETLHHVKPHGALYNEAISNQEVAQAIYESIKNTGKKPIVLTLKNSKLADVCKNEFEVCYEAFADRMYTNDLSLVSRDNEQAVLKSAEEVFEHVYKMVAKNKVKTVGKEELPIVFDTICVHGDHPNSVAILTHLHARLKDLNYDIG